MASIKQRYVFIIFFFTKLCHFGLAKVQYRRYRKGVYLKYGVIPTSASRSVSCLYLTSLDLFDYKVARSTGCLRTGSNPPPPPQDYNPRDFIIIFLNYYKKKNQVPGV